MKAYGLILAMCVAVISAATASAQIRIVSQDRLEEVSSPRLSADSAYLRFDVTHIAADPMNEDDSPQTYEYAFTNEGPETLHIERLVSTCSCASATCSVKDVEPGQRAEVRVRYNPKGHPGRFERKVFVYTQKGNAPAAVLRLSVDVSSGAGLSAEWPVQMHRRMAYAFRIGIPHNTFFLWRLLWRGGSAGFSFDCFHMRRSRRRGNTEKA